MNRCVHLRPVVLAPLTPAGPALTSATIGPHCRIRGEAFAYHSVPLHCVACFRVLAFYVAWCCVSERCRQAPPCHGTTAADSREEGPGLVPRVSHVRNSATIASQHLHLAWSPCGAPPGFIVECRRGCLQSCSKLWRSHLQTPALYSRF